MATNIAKLASQSARAGLLGGSFFVPANRPVILTGRESARKHANHDCSRDERFTIVPGAAIYVSPADEGAFMVARHLARLISLTSEPEPRVEPATGPLPEGSIHLTLSDPDTPEAPDSYDLAIPATGVALRAPTTAGLY